MSAWKGKLWEISLSDKPFGGQESAQGTHEYDDTQFYKKHSGIDVKKTIDEKWKIDDKWKIDIFYDDDECGRSDYKSAQRIEKSLNRKRPVNEDVFSSNESDNLNLVAIEKDEIPDAVVCDNKHGEYKEGDDSIYPVTNREEDIDESLYPFVLGTVINKGFFWTFLVILDNPLVSRYHRVDIRVFPEWDVFDNYRGRKGVFLFVFDNASEFAVTFFQDFKGFLLGDVLNLDGGTRLFEGGYRLDHLGVVIGITLFEVHGYTHTIIDVFCDRRGYVLEKEENIDKKYEEGNDEYRRQRQKRISNRIFHGIFKKSHRE